MRSVDPNDIQGPSGFGPEGFLEPEGTFPYGIDFQNQPTATAPAQTVTVTQQLDGNLDWSTFQLGNIGFGNTVINVPSGLTSFSQRVDATATLGVLVDVTANFNTLTGVALWTFTSIDPVMLDVPADPFAGFLPPDDDSGRGTGFVNYTIRPMDGLASGATIDGQASVVFDTNPAIVTPMIRNTIDVGTPSSHVLTLPVTSPVNFDVSWTGDDDTYGSGIASYDIFVSDNGGDYTLLQQATTETSATFTGQVGHTYSFYSIAQDNVGHTETAPSNSDAMTSVAANNAPIANNQSLATNEDTSKAITLSGDDGDIDVTQALTFAIASGPSHGILSGFNASTGQVTYTPNSNYNGSDSFTFTVTDDGSPAMTSTAATASLTINPVNDAPTANSLSSTTNEDADKTLTLTGSDGDTEVIQTLTFAIVSGPSHGTLGAINQATGQVTYTPNPNYNGSDSFTFTVTDDATAGGLALTSTATTVNLTINPVNDPPTANAQSLTTNEDTAKAVSLSGGDGDGEVVQSLTFAIVSGPSHGALSGFNSATGAVTYTPNANYNGPDSFTFTVNDDGTAGGAALTSTAATVSFTINPVNDTPSANAQAATTNEDIAKTLILTGSDGDAEVTQSLTFTIVTGPSHGTLGTIDQATGQVTYTPNADYNGPDSFTFTVTDDTTAGGPALTSTEATVNLTVTAVNDVPTANGQSLFTANNTAVPLVLTGSDGDAEVAQTLTYSIVAGPAHGMLSLFNASTGTVTYAPNSDFAGVDSFTFQVSDDGTAGGPALTSAIATVSITTVRDIAYSATGTAVLKASVVDSHLQVKINNVGQTQFDGFDPAFIRTISITGAGGADSINLTGLSASVYARLAGLVLTGGAGNDTILGSDISETISGGRVVKILSPVEIRDDRGSCDALDCRISAAIGRSEKFGADGAEVPRPRVSPGQRRQSKPRLAFQTRPRCLTTRAGHGTSRSTTTRSSLPSSKTLLAKREEVYGRMRIHLRRGNTEPGRRHRRAWHASAHRPSGYSSFGCVPAEPNSASPDKTQNLKSNSNIPTCHSQRLISKGVLQSRSPSIRKLRPNRSSQFGRLWTGRRESHRSGTSEPNHARPFDHGRLFGPYVLRANRYLMLLQSGKPFCMSFVAARGSKSPGSN